MSVKHAPLMASAGVLKPRPTFLWYRTPALPTFFTPFRAWKPVCTPCCFWYARSVWTWVVEGEQQRQRAAVIKPPPASGHGAAGQARRRCSRAACVAQHVPPWSETAIGCAAAAREGSPGRRKIAPEIAASPAHLTDECDDMVLRQGECYCSRHHHAIAKLTTPSDAAALRGPHGEDSDAVLRLAALVERQPSLSLRPCQCSGAKTTQWCVVRSTRRVAWLCGPHLTSALGLTRTQDKEAAVAGGKLTSSGAWATPAALFAVANRTAVPHTREAPASPAPHPF